MVTHEQVERPAEPLAQRALLRQEVDDKLHKKSIQLSTSNIQTHFETAEQLRQINAGLRQSIAIETDFSTKEQYRLLDTDLHSIYAGQQLHFLDQLTILIAREMKRYNFLRQELGTKSKTPIEPDFSHEVVQSYFHDEDEVAVKCVSKIIKNRMKEFPNVHYGSLFLPHHQVNIVDVLQLAFDVWNDWRMNQVFEVKKGGLSIGKKDSNYHIIAEREVQRSEEIWEDRMRGFEGKITKRAIEKLATWRAVIGEALVSDRYGTGSTVGLLLQLDHKVIFEKLVLLSYIIDVSQHYPQEQSLMTAATSGRIDILVYIKTKNGPFPVVFDMKSSLRQAVESETWLTKLHAWTLPGYQSKRKTSFISQIKCTNTQIDASLSEINRVPVYHVDTSQVAFDARGCLDFTNMEQTVFSPYQSARELQETVELASQHPNVFTAQVQRTQQRTATKHSLADQILPQVRQTLPDLSQYLQDFFAKHEQQVNNFMFKDEETQLTTQLAFDLLLQTPLRLASQQKQDTRRSKVEKNKKK
jgi:hypothetical protein